MKHLKSFKLYEAIEDLQTYRHKCLSILRNNYNGHNLDVREDGKSNLIKIDTILSVEPLKMNEILIKFSSKSETYVIEVKDDVCFVYRKHVSIGTVIGQLNANDSTAFRRIVSLNDNEHILKEEFDFIRRMFKA